MCDANETDAIYSQDAVADKHPAIQVSRAIELKRFDVDSTKLHTGVYSTLTTKNNSVTDILACMHGQGFFGHRASKAENPLLQRWLS